MIKQRLGMGAMVHGKRRQKALHMPKWVWMISGVKQALKLIRVLKEYPLQSKKRRDYIVWRSFVLQKTEFGRKMPESMCQYFFHRIREARQYNPAVADSYEIDIRSKLPIIHGGKS